MDNEQEREAEVEKEEEELHNAEADVEKEEEEPHNAEAVVSQKERELNERLIEAGRRMIEKEKKTKRRTPGMRIQGGQVFWRGRG